MGTRASVNALENLCFAILDGRPVELGQSWPRRWEIKADRQADRPSETKVIRIVNIRTWNNNRDGARFILKINHTWSSRVLRRAAFYVTQRFIVHSHSIQYKFPSKLLPRCLRFLQFLFLFLFFFFFFRAWGNSRLLFSNVGTPPAVASLLISVFFILGGRLRA